MRLEAFFEKFDLFADTPDAVAKMRELILDLAIQGKLVERRASDVDGHSLLEKLRKLPPERNSKSRSPKDIAVEPETSLEIPNHWALTTVENTTRETGFFCDGDWVESKDQDPNGDVRLIQLADVGDGQYRDRSSRFMTKAAATRLNCSYLEAGDILVARMPDPLGRCCRFPGDPKPAVTVVDVCILRPNVTFFDPDFLVVAINCPRFRRLVSAQATGTTRSRISRSNLGVLPIPLPPLAEQKRIVAKVDELMALCDRLEAQQQERDTRHAALARAALARFADAPKPANLDLLFHKSYSIPPADFRKSILTLAIQGKLVPQDPDDEPAAELLAEIAKERHRLVSERVTRRPEMPPTNENDQPFEIPATWAWTQLGQVGDWGSGSTPTRGNHEFYGGGITWLKSGELQDNRRLVGSEETVTERALEAGSFRRNRPGDVLLAMYGATIGKAAILAEPAVTNQAVCGCTPFSGVLSSYLFFYLVSQRENLQRASEGGAQPNISKVKIVGYPFPLPPLAEQRRIVAKVDELMALVDALEAQLATARSAGSHLVDAVVAELTQGRALA